MRQLRALVVLVALATATTSPLWSSDSVTIDCNTCTGQLVAELAKEGNTILLGNNIDMDLTEEYKKTNPIPIAQGVTVIGTRNIGNPGPRLYLNHKLLPRKHPKDADGNFVCDDTYSPKPLFEVQGNAEGVANVRLLNFRLQGPYSDSTACNDTLYGGIHINSKLRVEIAHLELSGWSRSAIAVSDELSGESNLISRMSTEGASGIKIHENFIHHNQHLGGFGYGVVLGHGAYAVIEQNVFDYNRHAISADGRAGTGYIARRNLVLKGGGTHTCPANACFSTHQFDMHGTKTCFPGHLNCGDGGEYIEITHNAFQYTKDNSFKLRGYPSKSAVVTHNVFAHGSLGSAIFAHCTNPECEPYNYNGFLGAVANNGTWQKWTARANRNNTDTFGQYGVCDFDGDGRDDLFLATGVTWWYSHSAKEPWVYLNSDSRLLSELGLGYFDDDKKCDVVAVHGSDWVISRGGTNPWETLGSYGVPINQLRFHDFNGDGITDVFRRDPKGQWAVVYSPGVRPWMVLGSSFPLVISPGLPSARPWTQLGSSSFSLKELQFGDFNGDKITDILSTSNGQWSVSWGGSQKWQRLNKKLTGDLNRLKIIDVNGNGTDDILLYWGTDTTNTGQGGYWLVSWDGRSDWKQIPSLPGETWGYVGRFDTAPGANLLVLNRGTRISHIASGAKGRFVQHSRFAY